MDKADRTEDVLAVYSQLQLIQTEIESLKGQIKYYEQSASLSAISIRLIAEEGTQPIAIGPWRPEGAAKEAVEDLVYFFPELCRIPDWLCDLHPAGADHDRHPAGFGVLCRARPLPQVSENEGDRGREN